MANTSKGKCPACHTNVFSLSKKEGKVTLIVRCKCLEHPDDVLTFDIEGMIASMEEEQVVYVHKGNATLH